MKRYFLLLLLIAGTLNLFAASSEITTTDSTNCPELSGFGGIDQNICKGDTVRIGTNQWPEDSIGYVFSWSPASGIDHPDSPYPLVSPQTSTVYVLTVSSQSGCVYYDTVTMNVKQPADLMFFPPGPHAICQGQKVTLTGAYGFSNYIWNGPSGNINGRIVQFNTAGTYTLSATDAQGCRVSAADSFKLTVNTPITLTTTPSGNKILCTGQSTQLIAAQGFVVYNWHTPTGTYAGHKITASIPGNYYVTATDTNSCFSTSATINVQVKNPEPISPHYTTTHICPGKLVTLSAPVGFTNPYWITPEGTFPGRNLTVSEPGAYQLKALDVNNCLSESMPITLTRSAEIRPLILSDGRDTICPGDQRKLTCTEGFTSIRWNTPAGTTESDFLETNVGGTYSVEATDSNGCRASSEMLTIHESLPYKPQLSADKPALNCSGESVSISAPEGYQSYLWSDGTIARQTSLSTDGSISLQTINQLGCSGYSDTLHFGFVEPPVAGFSYSFDFSHPGIQFLSQSQHAETWFWDFGDGFTSTEQNPLHIYSSRAKWTVSLTVGNPCARDTITRELKIELFLGENMLKQNEIQWELYPNPGKDKLTIYLAEGFQAKTKYSLHTITGQQLMSGVLLPNHSGISEIDTSHLHEGIYLISINQSGHNTVKRWIKQ